MKPILLAALLLTTACEKIGADKYQHAAGGYIAARIAKEVGINPIVAAVGVNMAKELYDHQPGGSGWDNKDIIAGLVGGLLTIELEW